MYRVITRLWLECDDLWIDKARQLMMTWLFVAIHLHKALFTRGQLIFLKSVDDKKGQDIMGRLKHIYEGLENAGFPGLPRVLEVAGKKGTATKIEFPDTKSKIETLPRGAEEFRMYTVSAAFMDEAEFQSDLEPCHEAATATLTGGGKWTTCSTVNGKSFAWRTMYAIDEYTGRPKAPDRFDSSTLRGRFTEEQILNMSVEQFNSIPIGELVACVPGLQYRVNCNGTNCLHVDFIADPDKRSPEWRQKARSRYLTVHKGAEKWAREMERSRDEFTGVKVIGNWDRGIFVSEDADYTSTEPVQIGMDFGTTVCGAIFGQLILLPGFHVKQLRIFHEIYLRGSNTLVLGNKMLDDLKMYYSPTFDSQGYMVYPDPAGAQESPTTADKSISSSLKILRGLNIRFKATKFSVKESTENVQMLFSMTTPKGEPLVLIHPRCKHTIAALAGGWHFETDKQTGKPLEKPEKDGEHDHVGDMIRYLVANCYNPRDFGVSEKRMAVRNIIPVREKYTGRVRGFRRVNNG